MDDVRLSGVRILVVEDDPDSREGLALLLGTWGARVLTAGTADEALRVMVDHRPDVAVCDLGLPDDDGLHLPRRLRERCGTDIPMLALTGYVSPDDRRAVATAGFVRLVAKPADPTDLLAALVALVSGRRRGTLPAAGADEGHRTKTSG